MFYKEIKDTPLGMSRGSLDHPPRAHRTLRDSEMCEALEPRLVLAGFTLITHGFDGDMRWVNSMADQLAAKIDPAVQDVTRLNLKVTRNTDSTLVSHVEPGPSSIHAIGAASSVVVALDWTDVDTQLSIGTNLIAPIVAKALMDPSQWASFGLPVAPTDLPLHLIGHSRGGSLVSAVANKLGERGIWVDQLTLLDPRPAVEYLFDDALLNLSSNVVFADDYWRENWVPLDINGRPATGALNTDLSERNLVGDYPGAVAPTHSKVRLLYQGTIDTDGDAFDGIATLAAKDRPSWFVAGEELGKRTGFYYSRTIGGTRPLVGVGTSFGGFGARVESPIVGSQWPSIDSVRLSGSSSEVTLGQNVAVSFRYQDRDSACQVELVLDPDENPFNDNDAITITTVELDQTGSAVGTRELSIGTSNLRPGRFFVRAIIRDSLGQLRFDYALDAVRLSLPQSAASTDATLATSGSPVVVQANAAGQISLLQQSPAGIWTRTNLSEITQVRSPLLTPLTWTDPKDGSTGVAASLSDGLFCLARAPDGSWTSRNLTNEIVGSVAITRAITRFTSIDGLIYLAGIAASGDLVLYRQTGQHAANGWSWVFENLSRDHLAPQGFATPDFVGSIVSYTTAWNGLNIAGLDAHGDIQSVWWAPGQSKWEAANLTWITGAPKAVGAVTPYLTSWQGINLATSNLEGRLIVAWWVPGRNWSIADMSAVAGARSLLPSSISSWVTPWNAMNIAGLDSNGRLCVYWWVPGQDWVFSPIGDNAPAARKFAGLIAPVSNVAATISLFGIDSASSHVARYWWQPSFVGQWQYEDVSAAAG